jgi:hypothetical protein
VLRRSEEQVAGDRIETSEFMQQVFDDGSIGECLCAWIVSVRVIESVLGPSNFTGLRVLCASSTVVNLAGPARCAGEHRVSDSQASGQNNPAHVWILLLASASAISLLLASASDVFGDSAGGLYEKE